MEHAAGLVRAVMYIQGSTVDLLCIMFVIMELLRLDYGACSSLLEVVFGNAMISMAEWGIAME